MLSYAAQIIYFWSKYSINLLNVKFVQLVIVQESAPHDTFIHFINPSEFELVT